MKTYYVSLVFDFIGNYMQFSAKNKGVVMQYMNNKYGSKIWCNIYTEQEMKKFETAPFKVVNEKLIELHHE